MAANYDQIMATLDSVAFGVSLSTQRLNDLLKNAIFSMEESGYLAFPIAVSSFAEQDLYQDVYRIRNGFTLSNRTTLASIASLLRRRMRTFSRPMGGGLSMRSTRSTRSTSRRWVSKATRSLKKGSLSRKAKRSHMTTTAFACKVLRSPGSFSKQTRRQAQFYKNINRSHRC